MFRKMRRAEKETSVEVAEKMLYEGEYGIMSVVGDGGYAYGVPLNYAFMNGIIYFHCAGEGHKYDAIQQNPCVSFTVVGKTEIDRAEFTTRYESVIAFGKAKSIEGPEKISALKELIKKYSPDFIEEGNKYVEGSSGKTTVIGITVEHITGKSGFKGKYGTS